MGTVVFPDAPLKIYLDTRAEGRARRRYDERRQAGADSDYEAILASVVERDRRDSGRSTAPLRPADDVWRVANSDLTPEETLRRVLPETRRLQRRTAKRPRPARP